MERPEDQAIVASTLSSQRLVTRAREVLRIEADAITRLIDRIGAPFASACELILACHGRVVVSGMGKSGHIARKLAAGKPFKVAAEGCRSITFRPGAKK